MTERKNICITINSLASGGAEKQSLLLAKALKPHHNIIFVILNPQPIYQPRFAVLQREEIEHIFLPKNSICKVIAFIRLLKRTKINIIFSFLPTDTILSAICGKVAGVPNTFGGIRNSYIPKIKYSFIKIIHNYLLSYTIANNYAAYSSSIGFGFQKKVFVIPNGIEIKPFFERPGLDRETITIISLGRLVKQKDYETALKSISELKKTLKTDIKLKYRIVGHGAEKETIVAHIEQYDLQEEVEIISNPPNIYTLLESSDIYLSTSIFEGFSNSIMEAMNCGLPVVATDAGDNSRLVSHNKSGFITDLADYKKLGEHLRYLIEFPEERYQMGLESYNHLVESFSYSVFQKKYLNIIKNIDSIQIQDGEYIVQK